MTYSVVGLMNEHQLTIGETTFGGREVLLGPRAGDWYVVERGLAEGETLAEREQGATLEVLGRQVAVLEGLDLTGIAAGADRLYVVDQETQAKIDVVKSRLIQNYGYDDESATDVLNYVASIFARGDTKES